MSEAQKENFPERVETKTDTAPVVPNEQGYIGFFVNILQNRADQVQALIDRVPSEVKRFEKELIELKRTIADYKSQLTKSKV